MNEIHQAMAGIPLFDGVSPEGVAVEEVSGGLTNRNYKLTLDGCTYFLRIAGESSAEIIDRKAEEVNVKVISAIGVNADVLYFNADTGMQLTRFLDGARTMSIDGFKDAGSVRRAAEALRKVHACGGEFATRFDVFALIDEYLALLESKDAKIPDGFDKVYREAEAVRQGINSRPATVVPCHCDPLPENFLDTGQRMYIVDWEYAGNNDPMWDLGDLAVEAEFDAEQDLALLQAYFGGDAPADQVGRMVMYKSMSDLLWTLWGAIQVANDSPVDDLWAYALGRFERCKRLMAEPDFARHLDAVRQG